MLIHDLYKVFAFRVALLSCAIGDSSSKSGKEKENLEVAAIFEIYVWNHRVFLKGYTVL